MVKKILVVDDDADFRSYLVQILNDAGYESDVASSCGEALTKSAATQYDLILLDMMMPRGNGTDCLPELKRNNPRTGVIMITAFSSIRNAVDLVRKGASDYLAKPFKIDELLVAVKRTLEEATFEKRAETREFHVVLSALSSPIRSEVVRLLHTRKQARLIDITRDLGIEDRAKVLFHLKKLEQTGIVEHDRENVYSLTVFGDMARECLRILETHLSTVVS
jgi:DNA-binding NtrC family response regulator